MQISPISNNSFKGTLQVKSNVIKDISNGYSKWANEAGCACDIYEYGDYKIAKINTDCIEKISPKEIVVKNNPHGYTSYYVYLDENSVSFDTILAAYNAASSKRDIMIDMAN